MELKIDFPVHFVRKDGKNAKWNNFEKLLQLECTGGTVEAIKKDSFQDDEQTLDLGFSQLSSLLCSAFKISILFDSSTPCNIHVAEKVLAHHTVRNESVVPNNSTAQVVTSGIYGIAPSRWLISCNFRIFVLSFTSL